MAINKNEKTLSKTRRSFKEKYGKEVKELRGIIENSLTIEELIVNYNFIWPIQRLNFSIQII